MTQHLGTPPRPWAGLETRLTAVPEDDAHNHDPRRRELAAVSLVLGYLARRRSSLASDAG